MKIKTNLCPTHAAFLRAESERLIAKGLPRESAERVAVTKFAAQQARGPRCADCRQEVIS